MNQISVVGQKGCFERLPEDLGNEVSGYFSLPREFDHKSFNLKDLSLISALCLIPLRELSLVSKAWNLASQKERKKVYESISLSIRWIKAQHATMVQDLLTAYLGGNWVWKVTKLPMHHGSHVEDTLSRDALLAISQENAFTYLSHYRGFVVNLSMTPQGKREFGLNELRVVLAVPSAAYGGVGACFSEWRARRREGGEGSGFSYSLSAQNPERLASFFIERDPWIVEISDEVLASILKKEHPFLKIANAGDENACQRFFSRYFNCLASFFRRS